MKDVSTGRGASESTPVPARPHTFARDVMCRDQREGNRPMLTPHLAHSRVPGTLYSSNIFTGRKAWPSGDGVPEISVGNIKGKGGTRASPSRPTDNPVCSFCLLALLRSPSFLPSLLSLLLLLLSFFFPSSFPPSLVLFQQTVTKFSLWCDIPVSVGSQANDNSSVTSLTV